MGTPRKITALLVLACSAALALTACTSGPATPFTKVAAAPLGANEIVAGLVAAVPTAGLGVVYTAASDTNKLLGRPGGYTSKATFTDSRAKDPQTTDPGSVDLGGSVEIFPDSVGAVRRGQYIQSIEASAGFLAHEYDVTAGSVLLRLASGLTPDQAESYRASLAQVVGTDAQPVPAKS